MHALELTLLSEFSSSLVSPLSKLGSLSGVFEPIAERILMSIALSIVRFSQGTAELRQVALRKVCTVHWYGYIRTMGLKGLIIPVAMQKTLLQ